jgi:phospholipid/cholesterol/gamma-HCH transport system substrate-binding protein
MTATPQALSRSRRMAALIVLVFAASTGCKFSGIYSFPLPGAVANGGNTYTVNVQFNDVQDLVPYSAVKVDDATVGHVKSVSVQGHHALVVVQMKNTVKLPANSTALVSQTSLLGEKFVAIQPPANRKDWRGSLKPGATITLPNTDTDATIEEVLGSLSLVLNGGGLENIQTITQEVNKALTGREGNTRGLLEQLKTFATGLNSQKSDIITALEKVDHLAATIRAQESTVTHAIDTFPAALQVLSDNTTSLTKMLTALSNLGDVATKVVNDSKDDLLTNLRNLQPTLTELAKAGDQIPKSLQILITFPEADGTQDVYRGDYTNVNLQIDLSTSQLVKNFGLGSLGSVLGGTPGGTTGTTPPATTGTSKNPLPIPIPSAIASLLPKIGSTGTKAPAKATPTPTPKASKSGGLLGGLLGANSAVTPRVETGARAIPMTSPLDELLLGPLQ